MTEEERAALRDRAIHACCDRADQWLEVLAELESALARVEELEREKRLAWGLATSNRAEAAEARAKDKARAILSSPPAAGSADGK